MELEASKTDLRTIEKPTKRQYRFIEAYLDPKSDTFGNAYQSAKVAGFKESYARSITANARNTPWIQEMKQLLQTYEPDHIYRAMQHIALNGKQERDQLRALELMGKAVGMFVDRSESTVNVTFRNDVPRPVKVIDATPETPTEGKSQQIEGGS